MSATNPYSNLIKATRLKRRKSSVSNLSEEFTSDKTRIVFSSPFRRLQQKTQVFSLETNASVRSRLTHTLEVASIGISLSEKICSQLIEKKLIINDQVLPFIRIVENACLMHDIGNPPFGHFAEEAIKKWFAENWKSCYQAATNTIVNENSKEEINTLVNDFLHFDGNPQAVRIVTTLQEMYFSKNDANFSNFGMNLTNSQVASIIKYVPNPSNLEKSSLYKKPGYFHSEEEKVKKIRESLGLKKRFPLTYIMEAADDMSYCLSDIEDGFEKKILTTRYFFEKLLIEYNSVARGSRGLYYDLIKSGKKLNHFNNFKINLIRSVERQVVSSYIKNHEAIINGEFTELISSNTIEGKLLQCLKTLSRKYLFRNRETESKELAGYHAIYGILNKYQSLLTLPFETISNFIDAKKNLKKVLGAGKDFEWRLFNQLPEKYIEAYQFSFNNLKKDYSTSDKAFLEKEWFYRSHLILDYISGMTDNYVLETYNLLYGIKV